jgi:hypothetical protein
MAIVSPAFHETPGALRNDGRSAGRAVVEPLVVFAAGTGLRPEEWLALSRRNVDRSGRAVTVRPTFSSGESAA